MYLFLSLRGGGSLGNFRLLLTHDLNNILILKKANIKENGMIYINCSLYEKSIKELSIDMVSIDGQCALIISNIERNSQETNNNVYIS